MSATSNDDLASELGLAAASSRPRKDAQSPRLTGKLRRLHSSRVRSDRAVDARSAQHAEADKAPSPVATRRVFHADDAVETPLHDAPPSCDLQNNKRCTDEGTSTTSVVDGVAVRVQQVEADHLHGRHPLTRYLHWPDPSAVVGLHPDHSVGDILFLDIETAGLRHTDPIINVGVGWWEGVGFKRVEAVFHVKQWMLHDINGERAMLEGVADVMARFAAVATYNGASFDLPRLGRRFAHFGLEDPCTRLDSVDLLHSARKHLPRMQHKLGLNDVERTQLGFTREDDLPGREVPRRFARFQDRGDPGLLEDILHHNFLDVLSLTALIGVFARSQQLPLPIKGRQDNRRGVGHTPSKIRRRRADSAPKAQPPQSQKVEAPLSPLQKKLATSYTLRAKHRHHSTPRERASERPRAASQRTSPEHAAQTDDQGERLTALRHQIDAALRDGGTCAEVAAQIFELVALAPRHPFGLEKMAQLYEERGHARLAREVRTRLSRVSPY